MDTGRIALRFEAAQVEGRRMARNTKRISQQDESFDELEELTLDASDLLDAEGELDVASSIEDLEAQISLAAEELARESRGNSESPSDEYEPDPVALDVAEEEEFSMAFESDMARTEPAAKAAVSHAEATSRAPVEATPSRAEVVPATPLTFAPANDDQQRTNRAKTTVEVRQPRTIYWATTALSTIWIGGTLLVGQRIFGSDLFETSSVFNLAEQPQLMGTWLTALLPVIPFWGFAVMMRRAQEMRAISQRMGEAAFRLLEPDDVAHERVMNVGQAVRREVQAMGEGIERTLARAIELETLVQTEVNELERAYSANESRIRLLVDSLGSEREGIISHAERVRASITDAHAILKVELAAAGDQIRSSVDAAAQKLAESLSKSGEDIVSRIGSKGEALQESFLAKASAFSDELSNSTGEIANLLDSRFSNLSETVSGFLNRI